MTLVIVAVAVAALLAVALGPTGNPSWFAVVSLICCTIAFEVVVARFSVGFSRWTMSVSEAGLAVALLTSPGAWVAAAGALGMLGAQLIRQQKDIRKLVFNTSQYALAYALAGWISWSHHGAVWAAVIGMGVFWLLNAGLVTLMVSLAVGEPFWTVARRQVAVSAYHAATNTSIGLGVGHLLITTPTSVLAYVAPIVTILYSYDIITRQVDEAALLNMMLTASEGTRQRSSDESAQMVLRSARELFGTEDVTLLTLTPADDPARLTFVTGQVVRSTLSSQDLAKDWVLAALASKSRVIIGSNQSSSWCLMRLGPSSDPTGVLAARKPKGDTEGIRRRDRRLAELLTMRAHQWLSGSVPDSGVETEAAAAVVLDRRCAQHAQSPARVADPAADPRALGHHHDPTHSGSQGCTCGAAAAPTLATLRSAAYQLVDVATRHPDRDQEIVTQLHRVEKAVATLLGVVRLNRRAATATGGPATHALTGETSSLTGPVLTDGIVINSSRNGSTSGDTIGHASGGAASPAFGGLDAAPVPLAQPQLHVLSVDRSDVDERSLMLDGPAWVTFGPRKADGSAEPTGAANGPATSAVGPARLPTQAPWPSAALPQYTDASGLTLPSPTILP